MRRLNRLDLFKLTAYTAGGYVLNRVLNPTSPDISFDGGKKFEHIEPTFDFSESHVLRPEKISPDTAIVSGELDYFDLYNYLLGSNYGKNSLLGRGTSSGNVFSSFSEKDESDMVKSFEKILENNIQVIFSDMHRSPVSAKSYRQFEYYNLAQREAVLLSGLISITSVAGLIALKRNPQTFFENNPELMKKIRPILMSAGGYVAADFVQHPIKSVVDFFTPVVNSLVSVSDRELVKFYGRSKGRELSMAHNTLLGLKILDSMPDTAKEVMNRCKNPQIYLYAAGTHAGIKNYYYMGELNRELEFVELSKDVIRTAISEYLAASNDGQKQVVIDDFLNMTGSFSAPISTFILDNPELYSIDLSQIPDSPRLIFWKELLKVLTQNPKSTEVVELTKAMLVEERGILNWTAGLFNNVFFNKIAYDPDYQLDFMIDGRQKKLNVYAGIPTFID